MKYGDIVYYTDEINDEINDFKITPRVIDENYKYTSRNLFYHISAFITYRLILLPFAFIKFKWFNRIKIIGKKNLKQCKKEGYFVFANHTNQFLDGFMPTVTTSPKKPYLIVNADNVSIPIVGKMTPMWGAIPLPDNMQAAKNFYKTIELRLEAKNPIYIYPEAHMWPYYTKIRPFKSTAFRYPLKYNKPIFISTTTYQKPKKVGKKPKVVIYIDGPFYPDPGLNQKDNQEYLRNLAYNKMVERSKNSNYEYLNYQKKKENNNEQIM